MRNILKTITAASILAFCVGAAQAASIVYNVDNYVGDYGHLTGTVETDGTIGTLSAANFVAWNFTVQGDGASDVLTNFNSNVFSGGSSIRGDATNLYFDFDNTSPSYLLFQKSFGSGNSYVCAASTPYESTPCYQGASLVPVRFDSATSQFSRPAGEQIIASVVSAAPEPATWAMMIVGFGLAGTALRRRPVLRVAPRCKFM